MDRAAESGLTLRHVNGMSGKFHYAEVIPPGAALFDYDNDGDLDVYLVQGRALDGPDASASREPIGRIFRNDLAVNADGTRTLRFTDVTEASGIDARGYGMGAATGDFDNDGCVDLYLTSQGPNAPLSQQLRRHVHRRLEGQRHGESVVDASRRRSSTTTATVGWISSSATI